MDTVIKKLNKEITKKYVISADSKVTIYQDSYENGDGTYTNSIITPTEKIITDAENMSVDLTRFIQDYIANVLNIEYVPSMIKDSLIYSGDFFKMCLCVQVDMNDRTPTDEQIELWKEGTEALFIKDVSLRIEFNSTRVTNDLLYALMFNEDQVM